ncbi:tetratricopeptide repeat protein [Mariniflexile gromovii]|uniref:Tetratricopeptide repeat protein n=1 Tax=Mariniflexile gromovii TaxID=362523 RepID=A0ABS4BU26_9FLAO|nr:tetratricopeptide repeat protein [Mariniflexile gromovii]MBP0904089.1 tetratricopeptide repeat protein [Mariniflexile gromovii]
MKRLLPTVMLLFLSVFVCAQQKEIDSLNELLKKHKELDTIRLNILNSLSYHYESVNTEHGLVVSDQAIALAQKLNYKEQLARAYINKANNYISAGKDSLALKLYYKTLDIFNSKNSLEGSAKVFYGIARIHQNWADYNTAILYYNKGFQIFELKQDNLKMAKMLNGIGICQMYSNEYSKAIETFIKALRYYETENYTETTEYGIVLTNIGIIYNRMGNKLNLALKYNEQAVEVLKKTGYKIGLSNSLNNLANTYDNLKQPLKAIELQQESYNICKEVGYKAGMASALTNIGIAYTSVPDNEKAIHYLKQALPIYNELGNKYNLSIVEYYLGETFLEMPSSKSNLLKAEYHLMQAYKISKETGNLQIQADANNTLSKLFGLRGDYKNALEFKTVATVLKDSMASQDLKDEITRLEVKYEYDKKADLVKAEHDKNQALANAEIERQKLIKKGSIISGVVLFLLAISGLFLYKRKRDAVTQKQEAEFNTKVANTELKALRAQMNPHFIFNSLNSVNDYISKNDVESASTYLTKFAKIMRQTLENSNQNEISLEDDLKVLDLYLQIESMRLKNKFTYKIKVDDAIDTENTLVPPLILQPFIENSIWHGISKKESEGHIDIGIKKEGNMLVCTVDDNGVGRTLNAATGSTENKSLGISITKSRIDILNKKKNTNGDVKMIDKEQGVRVEVMLPLQLAF